MTHELPYLAAGAAVFMAGLVGTLGRSHLFWKVLGINFMGSGIFLVLSAASPRLPGEGADPVPQAMILTGIVVTAAVTAVALGMALRVVIRTGYPFLSEDIPASDEGPLPRRARAQDPPADGST
ncbi:MAG: NADH-quinone oxidoreductase subunit K [Gemmatimonadota bacterium]|nr:NADH-quinone oxidoreductase subunit K [Gemmatimonadota bacterium]